MLSAINLVSKRVRSKDNVRGTVKGVLACPFAVLESHRRSLSNTSVAGLDKESCFYDEGIGSCGVQGELTLELCITLAATAALRRKKQHEQELERLSGTRLTLETQVCMALALSGSTWGADDASSDTT